MATPTLTGTDRPGSKGGLWRKQIQQRRLSNPRGSHEDRGLASQGVSKLGDSEQGLMAERKERVRRATQMVRQPPKNLLGPGKIHLVQNHNGRHPGEFSQNQEAVEAVFGHGWAARGDHHNGLIDIGREHLSKPTAHPASDQFRTPGEHALDGPGFRGILHQFDKISGNRGRRSLATLAQSPSQRGLKKGGCPGGFGPIRCHPVHTSNRLKQAARHSFRRQTTPARLRAHLP
jgi:hypothetical protein